MMKRLTLTVALLGLIFATSCNSKKETTVVDQGTEETTVVDQGTEETAVVEQGIEETTTGTETALNKLEADLKNAEKSLAEAKAKGNKEAEKIAQEAVNKIKSTLEVTKNTVSGASQDIKDAANKTINGVKEDAEKAKQGAGNALKEVKEDVNKDINSVKEGGENTLKEAKEDAKKNINGALDKVKVK